MLSIRRILIGGRLVTSCLLDVTWLMGRIFETMKIQQYFCKFDFNLFVVMPSCFKACFVKNPVLLTFNLIVAVLGVESW